MINLIAVIAVSRLINNNESKSSYSQTRKLSKIINIDRRYRTNLILF